MKVLGGFILIGSQLLRNRALVWPLISRSPEGLWSSMKTTSDFCVSMMGEPCLSLVRNIIGSSHKLFVLMLSFSLVDLRLFWLLGRLRNLAFEIVFLYLTEFFQSWSSFLKLSPRVVFINRRAMASLSVFIFKASCFLATMFRLFFFGKAKAESNIKLVLVERRPRDMSTSTLSSLSLLDWIEFFRSCSRNLEPDEDIREA